MSIIKIKLVIFFGKGRSYMPRKSGRPVKTDSNEDNKQKIIDATVHLIKTKGADHITVRGVCKEADVSIGTFYHYFRDKDDLMMFFVRTTPFNDAELETPLSDIASRISELYMMLIDLYLDLGEDFMKSFYSTSNLSLSAYMGEEDGCFAPDTVMARSEVELQAALDAGYVDAKTDVHTACMDICTIIKGCVFEWCLVNGDMDIRKSVYRIIGNYLNPFLH